jgi:hypothetical protein
LANPEPDAQTQLKTLEHSTSTRKTCLRQRQNSGKRRESVRNCSGKFNAIQCECAHFPSHPISVVDNLDLVIGRLSWASGPREPLVSYPPAGTGRTCHAMSVVSLPHPTSRLHVRGLYLPFTLVPCRHAPKLNRVRQKSSRKHHSLPFLCQRHQSLPLVLIPTRLPQYRRPIAQFPIRLGNSPDKSRYLPADTPDHYSLVFLS